MSKTTNNNFIFGKPFKSTTAYSLKEEKPDEFSDLVVYVGVTIGDLRIQTDRFVVKNLQVIELLYRVIYK